IGKYCRQWNCVSRPSFLNSTGETFGSVGQLAIGDLASYLNRRAIRELLRGFVESMPNRFSLLDHTGNRTRQLRGRLAKAIGPSTQKRIQTTQTSRHHIDLAIDGSTVMY